MKMTETKIKQAEALKWFHCIDFGGYATKGVVDHCSEELANYRYGIPEDLNGLSVLDVGCNNGYFSFLAEKRGAKVIGIEPNQGDGDNVKCFEFAKKELKSKVELIETDLQGYYNDHIGERKFDLVFYFGVLYHILNPLQELKYLFETVKDNGHALIETAIVSGFDRDENTWQFNHGYDGDTTNFWYPSIGGLFAVLKFVGFKDIEVVWTDSIRATVKASK